MPKAGAAAWPAEAGTRGPWRLVAPPSYNPDIMNREAITLSAAFFASLVSGDRAKSFTLPWILPANAALLGYQMKGTFLFPNAGDSMGLQLVTAGPAPQLPLMFTNGNGSLATSGLFLSTRSQKSIIISAFGSPPNGGVVVLDLIWAPLTTSSVGALDIAIFSKWQ